MFCYLIDMRSFKPLPTIHDARHTWEKCHVLARDSMPMLKSLAEEKECQDENDKCDHNDQARILRLEMDETKNDISNLEEAIAHLKEKIADQKLLQMEIRTHVIGQTLPSLPILYQAALQMGSSRNIKCIQQFERLRHFITQLACGDSCYTKRMSISWDRCDAVDMALTLTSMSSDASITIEYCISSIVWSLGQNCTNMKSIQRIMSRLSRLWRNRDPMSLLAKFTRRESEWIKMILHSAAESNNKEVIHWFRAQCSLFEKPSMEDIQHIQTIAYDNGHYDIVYLLMLIVRRTLVCSSTPTTVTPTLSTVCRSRL